MTRTPIKIALVGAGHRGILYAKAAAAHTEHVKIVALAEPNEYRRKKTAADFDLLPNQVFETAEALAAADIDLDCVINGTMDQHHIPTTLPLLQRGWSVLLEKPICTKQSDLALLKQTADAHRATVMVCHVLRYAPFYVAIKRLLNEGRIGKIVAINTEENVSYHHMAVGFIRGRWSNEDVCGSPMLMAKCCHDLDLIAWYMSGIAPAKVSSFGGLHHFHSKNAPNGSGRRCMVDCNIEPSCPYSAYNNYVVKGLWRAYAWESIEHMGDELSEELKIKSLKTDNPFGRCVWHCDNNVVDRQTAGIEFEDGTIAVHNLLCATSKPCRSVHIVGTEGEIQGVMEDAHLVVRKPDRRAAHEYKEEKIDISVAKDGHGGGDRRLVDDFVRVMLGESPSISSTTLDDSIYGHLIGFAADRAMKQSTVIDLQKL